MDGNAIALSKKNTAKLELLKHELQIWTLLFPCDSAIMDFDGLAMVQPQFI